MIDKLMEEADYFVVWQILPKDEEIEYHENFGGAGTPLNGL